MGRTLSVVGVGLLNPPDLESFIDATNVLGTHLKHLKHRFFEWRRRVRSRGELMSLSDAELRDIGLSRSEAEVESSKVFWLP